MVVMKHCLLLPLSICLFGVISVVSAQAQAASPNIRFSNPPTMVKPPPGVFSQVVEADAPSRIIYIAGQLGVDVTGTQGGDFRAQATLAFENIKAGLASVGGGYENVVKLNTYLTDMRTQLPILREVLTKYVNTAAPPANTTVEISRLARDGALIEVEAVALLPAR
jgi:2-iminobutanoate/2-iminopropanoate deaminase